MRIIHGSHSGRRIHIPKSFRARPTTDQAREALFNILINRIDFEECHVLDLFAGTGSISFEFASLGCPAVTAVDNDRFHAKSIQDNAEAMGFDAITVFKSNVFEFLESTFADYSIVFADPPFDLKAIDTLPDKILGANMVKKGGFLILEHGPNNDFQSHKAFQEVRRYGKVRFSFFRF